MWADGVVVWSMPAGPRACCGGHWAGLFCLLVCCCKPASSTYVLYSTPAPALLHSKRMQHPDLLERAKWEAAEVRRRQANGSLAQSMCMHASVMAAASDAGFFALALPACPSCRPQDYGNPQRSGKMQVLAKVLNHWHEQGHK